jgi:uncharacterized membrane protein
MARKKIGFSIREALSIGWADWKRQPLGWTGVLLAALITPYIPGAVGTALGDEAGGLTFALMLLSFLLSSLIGLGLVRVSLRAQAGEKFELTDLYRDWRLLGKFLAASVLYELIIFGGILLLVIPGIVWSIKFQYFPYLILEGKGPLEALKISGRLTEGQKWLLLALDLVLGGILALSVFTLGLGLLVAIPVTLVARAAVFRKLRSSLETKRPR